MKDFMEEQKTQMETEENENNGRSEGKNENIESESKLAGRKTLDHKALAETLEKTAQKKISFVFFAMLLFAVVESLATGVLLFPVIKTVLQEGAISPKDSVISVFLLFAVVFVTFMLNTGLSILSMRIVRSEFVTLGYVFYGFRKFKQFAPVNLINTGITALIVIIVRTIIRFAPLDIQNTIETLDILVLTLMITGIILLLFIIAFLNFLFVPYIKFDSPEKNSFKCFAESFSLMKKNYFRFIALVFRTSGINFLLAVGYFLASLVMGVSENPVITFFSLVFDFLYFINIYKATAKFYLAVPLAYDNLKENKEKILLLEA